MKLKKLLEEYFKKKYQDYMQKVCMHIITKQFLKFIIRYYLY